VLPGLDATTSISKEGVTLAHQRSLEVDVETDLERTAERLRAHRRSSDELGLEVVSAHLDPSKS
jgi:hypothetical protein